MYKVIANENTWDVRKRKQKNHEEIRGKTHPKIIKTVFAKWENKQYRKKTKHV